MPKKKTGRLSDIVPQFAPQGANDRKWFLVEHQLVQAKMSLLTAIEALIEIGSEPENDDERRIATDCLSVLRPVRRQLLSNYATFLSYLSGTDVPERISQMEV